MSAVLEIKIPQPPRGGLFYFFFSSRRRHTRSYGDWSSDVCSSDLDDEALAYLHGLPIIPIQRNSGMDAILNAKPGENPILIRVQRRGESLADAAELQIGRASCRERV